MEVRATTRTTRAGTAGGRVERITDLHAFDRERERWERLERRDPHATVFTSWRWLRAYLPTARHRWTILVHRDGDDAVAYLPIACGGTLLDRELFFGGSPVADYTGMIALPAHETRAAVAFADAIDRMTWDAFNATDMLDPRLDVVVERLRERGAVVESTDETRCLSCALPATWDEYVKERISAKTRVNTLRVERRLAEAFPAFRVSSPTAGDVDRHVDAMIAVNHARWGGNAESARRRYGRLFRNAFDQGLLRLTLFWDGERPIAGSAAFADEIRSSVGLYMLGFDEAYEKYAPGKGIVGRTIRSAIEDGFARFDFLRGDEPFKAQYAPELHRTRHVRLRRRGLRGRAVAWGRPRVLGAKIAVANVLYGPGRSL